MNTMCKFIRKIGDVNVGTSVNMELQASRPPWGGGR